MKPLPIVLTFIGYTLIYAAVAAGGKFATEPWAGFYADAYTEKQSSTDASSNDHPWSTSVGKVGGTPLPSHLPKFSRPRGQGGLIVPTVAQAKNG